MLQAISIANKVRASDDVVWRCDGEDDRIIILSKEELALPLILNPTAARIFLLCDGKNTVEDIARILCDEFGQGNNFEMVLEDVKDEIRYFLDKGIVKGGG